MTKLWRDERGGVLLYLTIAFTAIIGVLAFGAEGAMWLYQHRQVQSAADAAAYSAVAALGADSTADYVMQARGVVASDYGFVNGANGVSVNATKKFTSATCYGGASHFLNHDNAIEAVVSISMTPIFSAIWLGKGTKAICGRAVALLPGSGDCLLSLGSTGIGIGSTANNLNLTMSGCGVFSNSSSSGAISLSGNNDSITADIVGAVGTIQVSGNQKTNVTNPVSGAPPVTDPYAASAASWPTTGGGVITNCATPGNNGQGKGKGGASTESCNGSLAPGSYPNGITLINNSTYTLSAGIYYLGGDFISSGNNVTIDAAAGVTLVLTGNSIINVTGQNSTLNLDAPTSGTFAGIAIWEPASTSTNIFGANSFIANVKGVIYTPAAAIAYNGNTGASNCTQIVAASINFGGNSISFQGDCGLPGVKTFGQIPMLVE